MESACRYFLDTRINYFFHICEYEGEHSPP
jgi:hypothetical protein